MNAPVLLALPGFENESPVLIFWVKYSGSTIELKAFQSLASLVSDEVDQTLWVNPTSEQWKNLKFDRLQVIQFKPGVTDNAAASVAELLKFHPLFQGRELQVHSGEVHLIGNSQKEKPFNQLIQASESFVYPGPALDGMLKKGSVSAHLSQKPEVKTISLKGLSPAELNELSQKSFWALSETEMLVIQKHYGDRPVTDVEIEVLAQTWSEHCKHKIFGAIIDYEDEKEKFTVESLFKTYIQKPTFDLQKKKDWAISVFKDNAGIVRFHDHVDLCIKVETHNSPSALDPYGGALTGILGVNRDILGTGLGARPIANTNVLLFGLPNETEELPKGLFHPREILKGVHHGIQDGGNKSGIPTVNGAMIFDESFSGKPLVFCGTVGVLPRMVNGVPSASKGQRPGDLIVMAGGAVGYDGIHGATSSSLALDDSTPSTMVQIGDPLTQKRVMDFMLEARDFGLYNSVTDNGAGGLSSSIGEMASETNGAKVWLDRVPLKYPGLQPWQIFVSESQERMTLSVPPEKKEALLALAKKRNVDATVVGEFTQSGSLEIFYHDEKVANLSLEFLHDGLPKMKLRAKWNGPRKNKSWKKSPAVKKSLPDAVSILTQLVTDPSLASKEKWVRQYDHEVQAATVIKPFEGIETSAPNDGGVIWMGAHGSKDQSGAVVSSGLCPDFSEMDPEIMAIIAADEAVRNAMVTGADPDRIALIDNFCWPDPLPGSKNPDAEQKLSELVRTCRGLSTLVKTYEMPLISGKDSMKNDFIGKTSDGREVKISVLPTLLVTALGYHPNVNQVLKPHAETGSIFYLLGQKGSDAYFGTTLSRYYDIQSTPTLSFDLKKAREFYGRFYEASKKQIIASAHDLSEGGLLFALFESLLLNQVGTTLDVPANETAFLFGENPGRILVSVQPDQIKAFESHFENEFTRLGEVVSKPQLILSQPQKTSTIDLKTMGQLWRNSV
jgi:phosphoribosylformylglycinamidine synthase II